MGQPAPLGVPASGQALSGDVANAVLFGTLSAVGPTQPIAMRGPMNIAFWASYNSGLTTTAGSLTATVASAGAIAAGNGIVSSLVPPGTTVGAISGTTITLAPAPITVYGRAQAGLLEIIDMPLTAGLTGATVTCPSIPGLIASGTTVASIVQPAIFPSGPGTTGQRGIVKLSAAPNASNNQRDVPVPFVFTPTGNIITASSTDGAALYTGTGIIYTGSVQIERSFDGGSTWVICGVGGGGTQAVYTAGTQVSITFGEPEREVLYRLNVTALSGGNVNYRISTTGAAAESLALGALTS